MIRPKQIVTVAVILFVCAVVWRATGMMTPNAMGLAVGVVLGIMFSVPVALVMLASDRRR